MERPTISIKINKWLTQIKPVTRVTYRESLDILFDRHGLPDIFSDGRRGDGPAKKAIVDLVKTTTDKASPNFVPPEARIATFDQDGTTWVEHPIYTQVVYCLELVPTVVKTRPELKNVEPFKTVLSGDREAIAKRY